MTNTAVVGVTSNPADGATLVSLFTATLQFTSESAADAVVPPDGRQGLYLGSGNGVVSGERVRAARATDSAAWKRTGSA
jgi:hypothetical protein